MPTIKDLESQAALYERAAERVRLLHPELGTVSCLEVPVGGEFKSVSVMTSERLPRGFSLRYREVTYVPLGSGYEGPATHCWLSLEFTDGASYTSFAADTPGSVTATVAPYQLVA